MRCFAVNHIRLPSVSKTVPGFLQTPSFHSGLVAVLAAALITSCSFAELPGDLVPLPHDDPRTPEIQKKSTTDADLPGVYTTGAGAAANDGSSLILAGWQLANEQYISRLAELDYSYEDLEQATQCLLDDTACRNTALEEFLRNELPGRSGAPREGTSGGTSDFQMLLSLADLRGHATRYAEFLSRVPPQSERQGPIPASGAGARATHDPPIPGDPGWTDTPGEPKCQEPPPFISPDDHFLIFYQECPGGAPVGSADSNREVVALDGRKVRLKKGSYRFTARNAPDDIEATAVLLDSAWRLLNKAGFKRLKQPPNKYIIRIESVPLAFLTNAYAFVSPLTGEATIRPQEVAFHAVKDFRTLRTSTVVHEFIHQVQFDYGWNLKSVLFEDVGNLSDWGPQGRYLVEGLAAAMTIQLHQDLPLLLRFPGNQWDFWSRTYDAFPYGFVMTLFSKGRRGDRCFGCDVARDIFEHMKTSEWSRKSLFKFIAGRDARFTPMVTARMAELHEIYDNFSTKPNNVLRPSYRFPYLFDSRIPAMLMYASKKQCDQPKDAKYDIKSTDGYKTRCRLAPDLYSGSFQVVTFPVTSLPEQLIVRVNIDYKDGINGPSVRRLGGRILETGVRIHETTGTSATHRRKQFSRNGILRSYQRRWTRGSHLLFIDTQDIDTRSKRSIYRSNMTSLAFVFEWYPVPPTLNIKPVFDITIESRRLDADRDGIPDRNDYCPLDRDPSNANADKDSRGDVCDEDIDNDGIPNDLDQCTKVAGKCPADKDGDNIANAKDNCPDVSNWDQADRDGDDRGDACDNNSKPDLVVSLAGIPSAGAGFIIRNIGTKAVTKSFSYKISGYYSPGPQRFFFQHTLPFPVSAHGISPRGQSSTQIPRHILDPDRASEYQNVRIFIDSNKEIDELDETNNEHRMK